MAMMAVALAAHDPAVNVLLPCPSFVQLPDGVPYDAKSTLSMVPPPGPPQLKSMCVPPFFGSSCSPHSLRRGAMKKARLNSARIALARALKAAASAIAAAPPSTALSSATISRSMM